MIKALLAALIVAGMLDPSVTIRILVRLKADTAYGGDGFDRRDGFDRSVRLQPDRQARAEQDWPYYGGDQGGSKYSPLADVNASNVATLTTAWEWSTREKAFEEYG